MQAPPKGAHQICRSQGSLESSVDPLLSRCGHERSDGRLSLGMAWTRITGIVSLKTSVPFLISAGRYSLELEACAASLLEPATILFWMSTMEADVMNEPEHSSKNGSKLRQRQAETDARKALTNVHVVWCSSLGSPPPRLSSCRTHRLCSGSCRRIRHEGILEEIVIP